MSTEQLTAACRKPGCCGLLHVSWNRGRPQHAACTACQSDFRMCVRGENCRNAAGALQQTDAFHRNGSYVRGMCKTCQR